MRGEGLAVGRDTQALMVEVARERLGSFKRSEREWRELVVNGMAKMVYTKETRGYRLHYEMI